MTLHLPTGKEIYLEVLPFVSLNMSYEVEVEENVNVFRGRNIGKYGTAICLENNLDAQYCL